MSRRQRVIVGVGAGLILAVVVTLVVRNADQGGAIVAHGTVEATDADLGFQFAGRIEAIRAREGDRVSVGEELAWLDRSELRARLRAVRAQTAAARATLTELEAGFRSEEIAQARAALRAAEQRLEDSRRDLERTRRLHEGGAVSEELLDKHQTAYEVAQAELERAREQLQLLEAGPRRERIDAQRAAVEQAEAAVAQIEAALDYATIRAPFDGVISVRHREPGEAVPAGSPVLTLMNPDDRWVRIFVREDQVGLLSVGQRARISGDARPDRSYDGEVVFIADEAEFTPRNVQTTEERVKLVYRVKVRVTGDPEFHLKPGLAADVRLEPTDV